MTDSETQTTVENLMALNMLIFYFVTSMFTSMINEKLTSFDKLLFYSLSVCYCSVFVFVAVLFLVCFCFVAGLLLSPYFF